MVAVIVVHNLAAFAVPYGALDGSPRLRPLPIGALEPFLVAPLARRGALDPLNKTWASQVRSDTLAVAITSAAAGTALLATARALAARARPRAGGHHAVVPPPGIAAAAVDTEKAEVATERIDGMERELKVSKGESASNALEVRDQKREKEEALALVEALRQELEESRRESAAYAEKLEASTRERQEALARVASLQRELEALKAGSDAAGQRVVFLQSRLDSLEQALNASTSEQSEEAAARIKTLEKSVEDANAEGERTKSQAAVRTGALERDLASARAEAQRAAEALEAAEARTRSLLEGVQGLGAAVNALLYEPGEDPAALLECAREECVVSDQRAEQLLQEKEQALQEARSLRAALASSGEREQALQRAKLSAVREREEALASSTSLSKALRDIARAVGADRQAGFFALFEAAQSEDELVSETLAKIEAAEAAVSQLRQCTRSGFKTHSSSLRRTGSGVEPRGSATNSMEGCS
eukprot:CAMPEP_0179137946 /NCGR_PEP_ID=MMETSP0796-20121207/65844_1 /TAXON_ID=73915 /ORGANISM="Pyrodinium bahamense, Strain pbaha01" /LENGTH=475 /DNA_ID=CAMNT_0020837177 /DNA_START=37 /DNA_END=1460 /DNA_ORIENTATION=-